MNCRSGAWLTVVAVSWDDAVNYSRGERLHRCFPRLEIELLTTIGGPNSDAELLAKHSLHGIPIALDHARASFSSGSTMSIEIRLPGR
jgi:hypothetical protein